MEEEDLGSWLGLGIGGSHGERWSSVQIPRQNDKEETRGRYLEQAKNTEKGARKRLKAMDDHARSSRSGPSLSEEDADDGGTRKKLRLTKQQSTLLEDTFRCHNILSHVCSIDLLDIYSAIRFSRSVTHLLHASSFSRNTHANIY